MWWFHSRSAGYAAFFGYADAYGARTLGEAMLPAARHACGMAPPPAARVTPPHRPRHASRCADLRMAAGKGEEEASPSRCALSRMETPPTHGAPPHDTPADEYLRRGGDGCARDTKDK